MIDEGELAELIAKGQHSGLEFKTRPDKNTARTIVGMANASGGTILFGVTDSGEIVGCKPTNTELAQLLNAASNAEPPVDVASKQVGPVYAMRVTESRSKPVYCSDGYFIREGATTRKMKRHEIGQMMRQYSPPSFDDRICDDFSYPEHFDEEKYETWMRLANLSRNGKKEATLRNLELAEGNDDGLKINSTGVLFFATKPRHFFNQAFITCLMFAGTDKDRIIDREDLEGGIIADIQGACRFVRRNTRVADEIVNRYRTELEEYPMEAVAEAIVNAVAHRDWMIRGANVFVNLYSNRLEVVSPGGLPAGVTLDNMEERSVRRNPLISDMLNRAGLAERAGSGVRKILKEAALVGCPEPEFLSDGSFVKVRFWPNSATQPTEDDSVAVEKVSEVSALGIRLTDYMTFGANTTALASKGRWQIHLQKFAESSHYISQLEAEIENHPDKEYIPFEINGRKRFGTIAIEEEDKQYVLIFEVT